jgi:hypothetical protein
VVKPEAYPLLMRVAVEVIEAVGVEAGGPAHDPVHLVPALQQVLAKV